MAVEVIFSPEVLQDISEAFGWYEEKRSGLGEEFLSCVDACIQRMARSPELHALVHEEYRRALVRRFPYAVFYDYMEGKVTIYCVFHTARDPEKWKSRLR